MCDQAPHKDPSSDLAHGALQVGKGWPSWSPASATMWGYSPWQTLGRVWDTRPNEPSIQPEVADALKVRPAPGGVVMRSQYMATPLQAQRFAPHGPWALQLYAASWDWYPDALYNGAGPYPGPKSQAGHGFTWPFTEDYDPKSQADRVKRWACNVASRLVLDVAPYLATPGAEIDIGELAGGGRYVLAFWRAVNVLRIGTDDLTDVQILVPWELRAGRARHPVHRDRWCLTEVLRSPKGDYASDETELFDSAARHCGGWTPPHGGTATLRVSNGSADVLYGGVEEWCAGPAQRYAQNWAPGGSDSKGYFPKAALPLRVNGALNLYAAKSTADGLPTPALYHLEVGR